MFDKSEKRGENIMNANEFNQIFPLGEKNDAYAEFFVG